MCSAREERIGLATASRAFFLGGEPGKFDVPLFPGFFARLSLGAADKLQQATSSPGEIDIITAYLPQQMSDVEAGSAISAVLKEINAETMKDMGRAMAALKERFAGKMDFGKASGKIKELLNKK